MNLDPKTINDKSMFFIRLSAMMFALSVAFIVAWGVSYCIPDSSFMSGLKIRWWIPVVFFFLPLMSLSLVSAWFIRKAPIL